MNRKEKRELAEAILALEDLIDRLHDEIDKLREKYNEKKIGCSDLD